MGKNAEGAGSREEGEGTKEGGVCSFTWRKLKGKVFGNVSAAQGAVTQKRTLWGRGALQVGDLRLLEDGGEHGGALGSNVVAGEAARDR